MDKDSARNLILAGIYLIAIIVTGIFGYMLIDGFSFINAMYMTIITVSTVGFREAQPLSDGGKVFTTFLILGSLGVLTYFITSITQSLFKSQMSFFYPGFSKRKKNRKMENHVVVVGYGRNGDQVVKELMAFGSNVVVIDENHEIVINNIGRPIRFIEGNATDDEVLLKADIKSARALITTLPNDADNLFVVLTARALNPALKIISRASSDSAEKKLRMAGVDSVVLPERVGGAHMATLVAQPDIVEFLEHLTLHSDSPTQLMEIACNELPEEMRNKPIKEFAIRRKSGANIIGMKTAQGELIMNPSPDTKLIHESKLFVLGTLEQIEDLKGLLKNESGL
ncbi:MAG: potassium channel protein [Bacteroidetes bacterium]|nr:potassium channel protein [Bacteroidota bacterium]